MIHGPGNKGNLNLLYNKKGYQVADDEALSTNELIRMMADSQNKKAKIWTVPLGFIKALAITGDFLHLPLNSERLKN